MLESIENDSRHTVYLWSHFGQKLRARIENATYHEVNVALGKKPEDLSASTLYENVLDYDFRQKMSHAQVYTYWSNDGRNVNILTAPNGQSIYYIYDIRGRLSQTFRHNENGVMEILQLNDYHLINE